MAMEAGKPTLDEILSDLDELRDKILAMQGEEANEPNEPAEHLAPTPGAKMAALMGPPITESEE